MVFFAPVVRLETLSFDFLVSNPVSLFFSIKPSWKDASCRSFRLKSWKNDLSESFWGKFWFSDWFYIFSFLVGVKSSCEERLVYAI